MKRMTGIVATMATVIGEPPSSLAPPLDDDEDFFLEDLDVFGGGATFLRGSTH